MGQRTNQGLKMFKAIWHNGWKSVSWWKTTQVPAGSCWFLRRCGKSHDEALREAGYLHENAAGTVARSTSCWTAWSCPIQRITVAGSSAESNFWAEFTSWHLLGDGQGCLAKPAANSTPGCSVQRRRHSTKLGCVLSFFPSLLLLISMHI